MNEHLCRALCLSCYAECEAEECKTPFCSASCEEHWESLYRDNAAELATRTTPPDFLDLIDCDDCTEDSRCPCCEDSRDEIRRGCPHHDLRHTGTPSWQNRWTCKDCGKHVSR